MSDLLVLLAIIFILFLFVAIGYIYKETHNDARRLLKENGRLRKERVMRRANIIIRDVDVFYAICTDCGKQTICYSIWGSDSITRCISCFEKLMTPKEESDDDR